MDIQSALISYYLNFGLNYILESLKQDVAKWAICFPIDKFESNFYPV